MISDSGLDRDWRLGLLSRGPRGLRRYSRYFPFVEVNSTFYSYPADSTLRRWRAQVPSGFIFSLKAHQDISHRLRFVPSNETFSCLAKLTHSAEILDAETLVFQCPPSLGLNPVFQRNFRDLFSSIRIRARMAVELRTPKSDPGYSRFLKLLDDMSFLQVVDLGRGAPLVTSDVLYSRIFGRGFENLYQFSDDEITDLHNRCHNGEWKKVFLVFHTIGMYTDAARMQTYEANRTFLPVSRSVGVDSVIEVLGEALPAWRQDLVRAHGWKLCDWNEDKRVRLSEILRRIPERLYLTVGELGDVLGNVQL